MESDVKATQKRASTGAFLDQGGGTIARSRVRGFYAVATGSAGNIVLTDGVGGSTVLDIDTPAGAGDIDTTLPGRGILCPNGLALGTLTNVTSITVYYEG